MATVRICQKCGQPVSVFAPAGLCANCLIESATGQSAATSPSDVAAESSRPVGPGQSQSAIRNPQSAIGRVRYFGDYELLEEIAHGGMGVVYKARQVSLNRLVAVKMLLFGQFATEEFVKRFHAEAQAAANLDHPNIVAIHEVGEHQGQPYFSMDYVEGKNLAQLISDFGFRISDFLRAARYLKQIAEAIQYAHQKGVLHRDLKPSNILIDQSDQPRVTDFGLAKRFDSLTSESAIRNPQSAITLTGQVLGSPNYMPPEQAKGRRELGPPSDIYSLGAVLYHLLTGRPPFVAETVPDTLLQVASIEPASPRLLNASVPRDLETICLKCLEKEPARRYATAQGLAEELGRFLRDEPILARPIGPAARLGRWCRRNPVVSSLIAVSLILLLAVAVGSPIAAFHINRQRHRADRNAQNEARQRAQAEEMVTRLEIQNAEQLFAADRASAALAYLARVLRLQPTNRVAAERLLAALLQRSFLIPATVPLRHKGEVVSAQFSPNGQQVLTASHDRSARIWDVRSGQRLLDLPLESAATWAEFSPDGQKIATADERGNAQIWDAHTGEMLGKVPKHNGTVRSIQFSLDGQRIVTASGRTARVWDVRTGQLLSETLPHNDRIASARFSPDGEQLITSSFDKVTQIWSAVTGQPLGEPFKNVAWLQTAQFSPNGRRILTGGWNSVRVFDVRSGQLLTEIAQQHGEVYSAEFSPDGEQILTTHHDQSVRLWDSYSGRPLTEPVLGDNWPGSAHPAQFSPDGQRIVTLSGHLAQIWYLPLARPLSLSLQLESGGAVHFSPDGQRLLTVTDGAAQVWDVRTGQPISGPFPHGRTGLNAAFSPDGQWVVTGSWDHTARVWDARTGEPLIEPITHNKGINSVEFSPDGERVLTSSFDRTAGIWDARTGQRLLELRHDNEVHCARFSPDGKRVVTASTDRTARVWDAATGDSLLTLKHDDWVWVAEFSPDGQRVATACRDTAAHIWDARTGKELVKPLRHHLDVISARFSPTGDWVLTASGDNTVRLWDGRTGEPLTEPLRHLGYLSAQFSPDGLRVVTAGWEQTAKIWDVFTGQPVAEPLRAPVVSGLVRRAEFSPDGEWVVTAASDGAVRLWEFPLAAVPVPAWLPELAEAVAGQRFTAQRMPEQVEPEEFLKLKQQLAERSGTDFYARWARWFFADRSTRALSPSSSMTVPEHVQRCIRDDTFESLQEAVLLSPTNQVALGRLARRLLARHPSQSLHTREKADALSYRAVELAPDDPEALWVRAEVLEQTGRMTEALAAMNRASEQQPADPAFWSAKSALLVKAGALEEACAAISKAIALAEATTEFPTKARARFLLARSDLLKRMGRFPEAQRDFFLAKNIPARDPETQANLIDLSPYYNFGLDENWRWLEGDNLSTLPHGRQAFANVEFDVRGVIQLAGQTKLAEAGFPQQVSGIKLALKCRRLHFLHATGGSAKDGTQIGSYRVHYASGDQLEIPIIYANDVRGWHVDTDPARELTAGIESWRGTNAANRPIRLFKTTWENPHPDAEIASIDFNSALTSAAPFLVALRAE